MNRATTVIFATVAASRFVPQLRVLAGSLARHHPEARLEAALLDDAGGAFDPAAEPYGVNAVAALGFPDLRSFAFGHSRGEMAVAIKPFFLAWLLEGGAERVVFLDPDTWVLDRLDPLLDAARTHDLVLCPHRLTPAQGDEGAARELTLLRAGTFNGGVLACSCAVLPSLRWWRQRVRERFGFDTSRGLHGDQRWLDLLPGMVAGLHVLRDPGIDVAYWNLDERPLTERAGRLFAGDAPCRLFHWSGFVPSDPELLSRHLAGGATAEFGPHAVALADRYSRAVLAEGWHESRSWPEDHSKFDDGTPIPDLARDVYADLADGAAVFGDPFHTGPGSFREWLNQQEPEAPPGTSRLWWVVYRARADVRRAFPDPHGADREAFLTWCRVSGVPEHGIDTRFLPPV